MTREPRHLAMTPLRAGVAVLCLFGLPAAARAEPTEKAGNEPTLNPLQSIDPQSLRAFRGRPLFEASRRPFAVEKSVLTLESVTPTAPEPAPTPAPNLQLLGLLEINGNALAIVRDLADRTVHRLRTNDIIQDWTVTMMSHKAIELSRNEDRLELRMFSRPAGQDNVDAGQAQEDEPPPVKVPELTMEMFKKRYQTNGIGR